MPKQRKKLRVRDFAADGEPYSEIEVKISIRFLGSSITRSRLAVNIYPDPALAKLVQSKLEPEQYGHNDQGDLVACLRGDFFGWQDLNHGYPRFDARLATPYHSADVKSMNEYVADSVKLVLDLHEEGMKEAGIKPRHN